MALRADDVDLGRDRDLVERYQNGDPRAFDDLYRRYYARLHRFCLRHTRDHHEAEEIAQESFVRALRSMHSLRGERRFYPWMTVIAKRITIDRHRKLSRVEVTEEPEVGSVEPELDHLFDAVDADLARRAMARLGPRHREVLHLRETEGRSYADIAAHLEVPMTTVEALLHRARKALRREYATVSGDSRGLWGLIVLGPVGTRIARLRDRLGERWAELAAVAAPAAVAAVTAAVVLIPGGADTVDQDLAAAPRPTPRIVEGAEPDAVSEPGAPVEPAIATSATPGPSPSSTPPPTPPAIDAGPVDVFVGPAGHDQAEDEIDRQPVNGGLGPAEVGVHPTLTVDDVAAFVDDTLAFLGAADGSDETGTSTDTDDPTPVPLLGGSR